MGLVPTFFRSNKLKWIRKSTVKVKLKEWYARPPFRIRIFMILRNSLPGIFGWGCLSMLRAYSGRILTFSVLMNGGMPCHGNSVYHSLIFFSLFSQSLNIKDISMKVRKCSLLIQLQKLNIGEVNCVLMCDYIH